MFLVRVFRIALFCFLAAEFKTVEALASERTESAKIEALGPVDNDFTLISADRRRWGWFKRQLRKVTRPVRKVVRKVVRPVRKVVRKVKNSVRKGWRNVRRGVRCAFHCYLSRWLRDYKARRAGKSSRRCSYRVWGRRCYCYGRPRC